jgi:hypothetical protein
MMKKVMVSPILRSGAWISGCSFYRETMKISTRFEVSLRLTNLVCAYLHNDRTGAGLASSISEYSCKNPSDGR